MARRGPLQKVTGVASRNPWRVVAIWASVVVVLGAIGLNAKSALNTSAELTFPDAPSTEAIETERAKFGRQETLTVLLEGPRRELDRHGPRIARSLERIEGVSAISPFTRGSPRRLRLSPGEALVILQVDATPIEAGDKIGPAARTTLAAELPPTIESHLTGTPLIAAGIVDDTYRAMDQAQAVAIPALLIILLLIFRTPVAAAIPLVLGLTVTATGSGVLTIIDSFADLDANALQMLSLTGLALGVDYALLVVSRFREELAGGVSGEAAVSGAVGAAGRTVAVAGAIVATGMSLLALMFGEAVLTSGCVGIVTASLLSVAGATTLLPAVLTLVEPAIDRWRIGGRSATPRLAPLIRRLIRRPGLITAAALLPLLALAVPALGIDTGPPHVKQLDRNNKEVHEARAVEKAAGTGWVTPFELLAVAGEGTMASPDRLATLAAFERLMADDPDLAAVIGPGELHRQSRRLLSAATGVGDSAGKLGQLDSGLRRASRGLDRLLAGFGRADAGSAALASASSQALAGAGALADGAGQARTGAAQLAGGLPRITAGAAALTRGLGEAKQGTSRLVSGASEAEQGAGSLDDALDAFEASLDEGQSDLDELLEAPRTAESALRDAETALSAAHDESKADPAVQEALSAVRDALVVLAGRDPSTAGAASGSAAGITQALESAQSQTRQAAADARELAARGSALSRSAGPLSSSNVALDGATRKALRGAGGVDRAARQADAAGAALDVSSATVAQGTTGAARGLGRADFEARALARALSAERTDSAGLSMGLERISADVSATNRQVSRVTSGGDVDPDRALGSGYLTLGAIDAAPAEQKRNAGFVINAEQGGDSARLFVMSQADPIRPGRSDQVENLVRASAEDLAEQLDAKVLVGGRAAIIKDFTRTANAKRLGIIAALSLVTFLFLIVAFRSLLLAAKAVILNLLVVGAAFGVLALVAQGDNPPLGGPGWVDVIAFFATYGIVFTLSIDYEVFMINRMREGYLRTGSNEAAIEYGIERTAKVVSGAAAVMIVVFASFAIFGVGLVRQLGLGLAVAVFADATIVRLVLLPATMRIFGRANWWLPTWLDRRLPKWNMEGATQDATTQ